MAEAGSGRSGPDDGTGPSEEYLGALVAGRKSDAVKLALGLVDTGWSVKRVYLEVLAPALQRLGDLWQQNRISVAQEHFGSAVTELVMCRLYGVGTDAAERRGRSAVACAPGKEFHAIGLRMVADFLDMDGWSTYVIGGNTPIDALRSAVAAEPADLVVLSATMPHSISEVERAIATLRRSGGGTVPILVGGRAYDGDPDAVRRTRADAYARTPVEAVSIANRLVAPGDRAP